MNSVILIGRLVKDPELRFTANGKSVATFSVAVNRAYSKTNEADFFNVVVWGKPAENCANYLSKGKLVGLQGEIQNRSYEAKSGDKRYITEIVASRVEFLEWGSKNEQSSRNTFGSNNSSSSNDFDDIDLDEFESIEDEDIPF
ncbi:single-stranded DNA-binding protein [Serpentinicella alkaliphila]|uniref:Single-stranded DNA-binding protein n=1 Tax=Serpentinicella alkaliphila TaxID=1734049 RepID=A0A4R2TH41_9FIRM|nr:single-stranded DNA-binding protein [Serpentinicella alkaliphila]QUH25390.1 single-stranded DNA-binding protein [Serpentinicella alkaliphila]TCQ01567.1 single-strand binding protein [Serpentinicella alkaliphila]